MRGQVSVCHSGCTQEAKTHRCILKFDVRFIRALEHFDTLDLRMLLERLLQ